MAMLMICPHVPHRRRLRLLALLLPLRLYPAADPVISVPKLQRPLTPAEQFLGKQCRSNSDGDAPPPDPC